MWFRLSRFSRSRLLFGSKARKLIPRPIEFRNQPQLQWAAKLLSNVLKDAWGPVHNQAIGDLP